MKIPKSDIKSKKVKYNRKNNTKTTKIKYKRKRVGYSYKGTHSKKEKL